LRSFIHISRVMAIAIVFLMMTSILLLDFPVQPVKAQLAAQQPYSGPLKSGDVPNGNFKPDVWISARPHLVGVGQTVLVNVWATPASNAQRRLLGYQITITKPDGTSDKFTRNSEIDTAATWMEYIPDQIGVYKYKVDFPGTFCPAGVYGNGDIYTSSSVAPSGYQVYTGSTYYQPDSSPEYTFTVQQDMVWSQGVISLPTDYWTRPVPQELREWLPIIGDWPWYGPAGPDFYTMYPNDSPYWTPRTDFYPYVQGPSSAHIAWKQVNAIGGITGAGRYGTFGSRGWSYEVPFSTSSGSPGQITMVIAGRGFMTVPKVRSEMINGSIQQVSTTALRCVDIRTGELLWEVDGFTHSQTLTSFGSWTFGGAIEYPSTIVYLDGTRLCKYNANTGAQTLNTSISPLTSAIHYMNGYALGVQTISTGNYRLINFTTTGTSTNFTTRIASNITWPLSSLPATTDYTLGVAAQFGTGWSDFGGSTPEQRLTTVNLKTGQVIVNKSIAPAGSIEFMSYSPSADVCDHGIYAFLTAWGQFKGLDIMTGAIKWTSPRMDEPWDCNGFGAYDTTSAYGMFYRAAYSGIYAFDWKTGDIVWKYEAPAISPFETPYVDPNGTTVMSFNGDIYASGDGKIYSINTEHTPTQPITRGWQLHCINATTGEGIFKTIMTGSLGAIADGYLSVSESNTGTLYVFGKGLSETTITTPDTAATLGTPIVIKGTVVDLSPAQPGTPCVSKESMATQMEHIHRQLPIAGIWNNETIIGVPVSLDAVDPNGNSVHIGDVTTDGYSGTYGFVWQPELVGKYTVSATFMGDDSYGSSFATSYASVFVGSTPAPTTTTVQNLSFDAVNNTVLMAVAAAAIAIIIAIAIVGILILRKRP
jgi:hypothetical protein